MRVKTGMALAILLVATNSAQSNATLNPALGTIFPANKAGLLLKQCSREAPSKITSTWVPTAEQIVALERGFPLAFFTREVTRRYPADHKILSDMHSYARQYGGIVVEGKKLVYVNGFLSRLIDFDGTDLQKEYARDWRRKVYSVCDGGPTSFGVLFDPSTGRFTQFAFNGFL